MAWNLKSLVAAHGAQLKAVVDAEEAKHGAGVLILGIKNGRLDVSHVPQKAFINEEKIYRACEKCKRDGDTFVLFQRDDGTQEIGVLSNQQIENVD